MDCKFAINSIDKKNLQSKEIFEIVSIIHSSALKKKKNLLMF
jgi:hypothetical protein